ncbi:hypothetical protein DSO57_1037365 [Entomophthora muscae]|uniref:Uncharacterized protein n=1 Tax=Entomophthora muscae TaxID=34485 RepID=A0ACC2U8M0_9FUNG|nr:hypothetical protein DSO57_1037365 [Entomophthora muscae]
MASSTLTRRVLRSSKPAPVNEQSLAQPKENEGCFPKFDAKEPLIPKKEVASTKPKSTRATSVVKPKPVTKPKNRATNLKSVAAPKVKKSS